MNVSIFSHGNLRVALLSNRSGCICAGLECRPAAGEAGKPNPLKNVYFGEQHLHTVSSPDAFAFGTRNTPDEAYRFCKGEEVELKLTGEKHKKKTPYDWCAVTDHAEYLGMMPLLLDPDGPLGDTEIGKLIAEGTTESG